MRLRKLKLSDAPYMLEWMHDKEHCRYMQTDFASKTLDDCISFIKFSLESQTEFLNLAISDDNGEYMGTVSLKHIDPALKIAEFGIVIRNCACGKGYSAFGMKEIFKIGFYDLGLDFIVWCVSKANIRANRFYLKQCYQVIKDIPKPIKDLYFGVPDLIWYGEKKDEFDKMYKETTYSYRK